MLVERDRMDHHPPREFSQKWRLVMRMMMWDWTWNREPRSLSAWSTAGMPQLPAPTAAFHTSQPVFAQSCPPRCRGEAARMWMLWGCWSPRSLQIAFWGC
eukprot:316864-Rhodomonas_salina.1